MKELFSKEWIVKGFCPICHRPLHDVGLEFKAGSSSPIPAGTCREHGKVTPPKVYFQPVGRAYPDQGFAAAAAAKMNERGKG